MTDLTKNSFTKKIVSNMSITKWQTISFISKISAILMGLVGNIIILRILSPEDWGIVGLATSVVGTVSVLQHLGLANGLNREIAREKDPHSVPTVILTALMIRLPVSLAIAVSLSLLAQYIAVQFYDNTLLIFPIQLLATLVLLEGVQDIFSSAVGALKLFRGLFIFQVVLAFVYLAANIMLVSNFGIHGYFYAKYVYMGAGFVIFGAVLVRHFYKQSVNLWAIRPDKIVGYIRGIIGIGLASFFQKIASIYWQKLPTLVMGTMFAPALIGVYNFADFFSQRLAIFADAASDVSLPMFLRTFHDDFEQFKKDFVNNFLRVGVITTLFAVAGGLFLPEFLQLTGLNKYEGVQSIFVVSALGMLASSLVHTVGVVFVAADARKHMVFSFVLIFLVTLVSIVPLAQALGVLGGALSYGLGALAGLVYTLTVIRRNYDIDVIERNAYLFSPLLLLAIITMPLMVRVVCFAGFMLLYMVLIRKNNQEVYGLLMQKVNRIRTLLHH